MGIVSLTPLLNQTLRIVSVQVSDTSLRHIVGEWLSPSVMAASAIVLQAAGGWVSVVGILLLLVGGSLLRSIGQTTLNAQLAYQAGKERRTGEYTRGDKAPWRLARALESSTNGQLKERMNCLYLPDSLLVVHPGSWW
jgi:hypothetical protein